MRARARRAEREGEFGIQTYLEHRCAWVNNLKNDPSIFLKTNFETVQRERILNYSKYTPDFFLPKENLNDMYVGEVVEVGEV